MLGLRDWSLITGRGGGGYKMGGGGAREVLPVPKGAELNGRILGNIRFESDLCTRRLIGQLL